MHIPDVLSPPVIAATLAAGGLSLALSMTRARRNLREELVPTVGVLGAFVFAAQMVNFHFLPGTAVSTHLIGTTLLTLLLGPALAILVMFSVLAIQATLFLDGALLSLGANLLNMGVIPALITEAMRRVWLSAGAGVWRIRAVTIAAAYLGILAGALACAGEVSWSQEVADRRVLIFPILGIHALLGAGESLGTLLCYEAVRRMFPGLASASIGESLRA